MSSDNPLKSLGEAGIKLGCALICGMIGHNWIKTSTKTRKCTRCNDQQVYVGWWRYLIFKSPWMDVK